MFINGLERLKMTFGLTLYYSTETIWIENLGVIASRTIIISIKRKWIEFFDLLAKKAANRSEIQSIFVL